MLLKSQKRPGDYFRLKRPKREVTTKCMCLPGRVFTQMNKQAKNSCRGGNVNMVLIREYLMLLNSRGMGDGGDQVLCLLREGDVGHRYCCLYNLLSDGSGRVSPPTQPPTYLSTTHLHKESKCVSVKLSYRSFCRFEIFK